jgi:manganese transport protein
MTSHPRRTLLTRIGPGLITAAVVLGPGSIVASSRAGAEAGYGLVWVLLCAALLMATFTSMGARLGIALPATPLQYVARRWGRPLAAIVGFSALFVTAGFQFGNNIGVAVAMQGLTGLAAPLWPVVFTLLAITFLLAARQLYKLLERVMMVLVALMIVAFAANLLWAGIDLPAFARGLVPGRLEGSQMLIAPAILGTTFSVFAAFYQAYLVRAKGWTRDNIHTAIGDAWIGIGILAGIALVIMMGAGRILYGTGEDLGNIDKLATQLQGILGPWASLIFSLGIGAASFSSFIANALLGGALVADGLGQDGSVGSKATRLWTILIMSIGCLVAMTVIVAGKGGTQSLLIAQASTLVAVPICAVLLYGMTTSKAIMGELRNGRASIALGAVGLAVLGWLNIRLLLTLVG